MFCWTFPTSKCFITTRHFESYETHLVYKWPKLTYIRSTRKKGLVTILFTTNLQLITYSTYYIHNKNQNTDKKPWKWRNDIILAKLITKNTQTLQERCTHLQANEFQTNYNDYISINSSLYFKGRKRERYVFEKYFSRHIPPLLNKNQYFKIEDKTTYKNITWKKYRLV